jgi:hypothetical protein
MKHVIIAAGIFSLLLSSAVLAEVNFIWFGAPAEVRIRVGAETGITTVVHDVPASMTGDGTPISGTPAGVLIEVSARRATFGEWLNTRYIVTADSSTPLSNGSSTIPFTDISWTSQDEDIPSGRFDGSSAQVILGATRAFYQVRDWHTFSYDNTRVLPAGVYTGTVTYTVSIP